jgi:hypothetical protein
MKEDTMMRFAAMTCCLISLTALGGGGCSKFAGEWVEAGTVSREGAFVESTGPRRAALKFDPVCNVRTGAYVDGAGVVDHQAVTYDTYLTMKNGNIAQFGAVIAKIDGNRLVAYVGAEEAKHFVRVRGPSVFPPRVYARSTEASP